MSDLAREEAGRFFSTKEHLTSHPEDRDDDEKEKGSSDLDGGGDDRDRRTATRTNKSYHIPSTASHANTGPKGRTWGIVQDVDATGYLDAVDKAGADEVVVVLIYDAGSAWSRSIELELGMLAYKYARTRFVKLDQDIAEMESVQVPAVLAYRGGHVFATVSGADADGLEDVLKGPP
ncbi:hypothetical protein DV735_g31, partial [Chaetothyriales sp. CBS 134920]